MCVCYHPLSLLLLGRPKRVNDTMWHVVFLLPFLLCTCLVSGRTLKGTSKRAESTKFVTTSGQKFMMDGQEFIPAGTNAYWLSALNTDDDISSTFRNMSATGINVVRTWGFNDVNQIPEKGPWFQLIANGTTTINNGSNGLQRLDKVVELAEQHGIFLVMSLANNWDPFSGIDTTPPAVTQRDVTPGTDNNSIRNSLSNNYGSMDAYVREFGVFKTHDEFYTNQTIIDHFKQYTTNILNRYLNRKAIFAYELANDPRCNSTLPSKNCSSTTVTQWHATLAEHVASVDRNHLFTSGTSGFICTGCPKIIPVPTKPSRPAPRPSAAANDRRRKLPAALTKRDLIKERAEKRRRTREQKKREGTLQTDGIQIRGRWASTTTRRQDDGLGPSFDGSQGIDSEDISNIPQIRFTTFQLFPDQNQYAPIDPHLSLFNNTVQAGNEWIKKQAQIAQMANKPFMLSAFGLVTQSHAANFVPFNSTQVSNVTTTTPIGSDNQNSTAGVTDDQRDDAYQQWLKTGISMGIGMMLQYQWGQNNLTAATGTIISPNTSGTTSTSPSGNPSSVAQNQTGFSPDDGYSTTGIGQDGVQSVLMDASQNIGKDAS